jgi:hypothetical protein
MSADGQELDDLADAIKSGSGFLELNTAGRQDQLGFLDLEINMWALPWMGQVRIGRFLLDKLISR